MGALGRTLREDWKKSFELATNIVTFFLNVSLYSNFHSMLAHYKIGASCMQIVDYELKRWEAWKLEANNADERSSRKLSLAMHKLQQLLAVCLNLLLNLADDPKVEIKIVNRRIISLLSQCYSSRDNHLSLLISATNFLLKLSVYIENKDEMARCNIVESVVSLFPIKVYSLLRSAVRLLFNLSFIPSFRDLMVSAGLISHIAPMIAENVTAMNLLYQLSINDDAKAMITYTDAIQTLMRKVLANEASITAKAILVNIALEKRNAQLLCSADGQGLDLLLEAALSKKDHLLMKVVRNIASHNGPTQTMFMKWVSQLLNPILHHHTGEWLSPFALDCLGTVNQLKSVDWAELSKRTKLIPWIEEVLKENGMLRTHNDQLLQVVILCGTMARQLQAAKLIVHLSDQLVEILAAEQEDDEMVVQIIYVFFAIITHEELSESVMGGSAQIGAYLMDLMHDKNAPVRAICDRALCIIAGRSEEWARKMDIEKFRWHNAQWLEMAIDNNSFSSGESVISDSTDICKQVFGAEDILGDTTTLDDTTGRTEADF